MSTSSKWKTSAVICLLICLLIPLFPARNFESVRKIGPANESILLPSDFIGIEFPVTRRVVAELSLHITEFCSDWASLQIDDRMLINTSANPNNSNALRIFSSITDLTVRVQDEVLTIKRENQSQCDLLFQLKGRTATVQVGRETVSHTFSVKPQFSILVIREEIFESGRLSGLLRSEPFASFPSILGIVLRIFAVVLLLHSLIQSNRIVKRRSQSHPRSWRKSIPALAALLPVIVFWALAGPPLFDDGWYSAIISHPSFGVNFYNTFVSWDVRMPTSVIHLLLQSLWSQFSTQFWWMRILAGAYIIITLKFILLTLNALGVKSPKSRFVSALIVAIGGTGYLISLRPEGFIAMCLTIAVYLLVTANYQNCDRNILVASLISGLAMATHATGLIVPSMVAAWVVLQEQTDLNKTSAFHRIGTSTFAAVGLVIGFVLSQFAFTDLFEFIRIRSLWEAASDPVVSWRLRLFSRIQETFGGNLADIPLRRTFVLLFILSLFLCLWRRDNSRRPIWISTGFLLSLLLFSAIPSVGPWQLGAFLPLITLIVVTSWDAFENSEDSFKKFVVVSTIGLIIGVTAWSSPSLMPMYRTSALTASLLGQLIEDSITYGQSVKVWIGFSVIVASVCLVLSRRNKSGISSVWYQGSFVIVATLLASPLILQTLDVVENSVKSTQGSPLKDFINRVKGEASCGLAEHIKLPDLDSREVVKIVGFGGVQSDQQVKATGRVTQSFRVLTDENFIDVLVDPDKPYLLIYTKSEIGTGFVSISNRNEPDLETVLAANGINFRNRDGYQPILVGLAGLLQPNQDGPTLLRLKLSQTGDSILTPIAISQSGSDVILRKYPGLVQVSPEWGPLFPCAKEEYFSNGLSKTPMYLIGRIPSHPNSPASVFGDYEDIVSLEVQGPVILPINIVLSNQVLANR